MGRGKTGDDIRAEWWVVTKTFRQAMTPGP